MSRLGGSRIGDFVVPTTVSSLGDRLPDELQTKGIFGRLTDQA